MDFSLENMCRTCMNEEGQMFSVFSQENRGITKISYADMLMACASLHVFRNDDLPQNICQHCLKHLSIAYSFKQQSERSEATLREITKNPNIEFIKEEIYDPYIDSNDEDFKTNGCQNILSKNSANKSVQHEYEPQKLLKLQNQMNEFKTEFLEDEFHLEHEKIAEDVNIGYEMSRTNNYEAASDNTAFLDDNILVNNVLSHDYSENSNKMYEIDEKPILKPESLKFKAVQRLIRELKCPYCNQIFKSQQAFKKHKKNHAKKVIKMRDLL